MEENQMNGAWQRAIRDIQERDALERGGELGRKTPVAEKPATPKPDEKAFAVKVVVELTDAQKRVISMRFEALRRDFPLVALHALFAEGSEWKLGEFPAPKPAVEEKPKRRTRRPADPGYVPGTLRRLSEPWLELAASAPGEVFRVRASDFEGFDLRRVVSALSALSVTKYGKGRLTVQRVTDDIEGVAALIIFSEPDDVKAKRALRTAPGALGPRTRYNHDALPTASRSDAPTKEA